MIVSAGASEVISPFAHYLGAQHVIATTLEIQNGHYTGTMLTQIQTSEGKAQALSDYLQQNALPPPRFAFGDTMGDLGMLEMAQYPVALNPNQELEQVAHTRGWPIVSETSVALAYVQKYLSM